MWLSPPHNQKEVTVTCTGGNWKMLDNPENGERLRKRRRDKQRENDT